MSRGCGDCGNIEDYNHGVEVRAWLSWRGCGLKSSSLSD